MTNLSMLVRHGGSRADIHGRPGRCLTTPSRTTSWSPPVPRSDASGPRPPRRLV